MDDRVTAGDEQLGDQAPVAARPKGLGAHEARRGLSELFGQRYLPRLGSHPGRVAAEGRDSDATEALLARLAPEPSAELNRVPVRDPGRAQRLPERRLPELRVPLGARKAPHVDEGSDIYLL
jgi:hypothetical protein